MKILIRCATALCISAALCAPAFAQDSEVIKAIVQFPILMERPIVIKGNKAIIGRDLEKLEKFL